MTRNQADALIIVAGFLLEAGAYFGLTALGASERVVVLGALICMMLTCLAVGEPGIYPVAKDRERRR
jgi:hypothetical protein